MTLAEFALARCGHVLEQKQPDTMTAKERLLMEVLAPILKRYREREEAAPERAAAGRV